MNRKSFLSFLLFSVNVLLLACAVASWWGYRNNTLFSNGRWIVGKDTGKFLFYTYDFMMTPIKARRVDLADAQGFQEILYRKKEGSDRRLLSLKWKSLITDGSYLWVKLRKKGQRMLACRLSRVDGYPSGFFKYNQAGEIDEHIPFSQALPAAGKASQRMSLKLSEGRWDLFVEGKLLASISDIEEKDGYLGFSGSGWLDRPVTVRKIEMEFCRGADVADTWIEREEFKTGILIGSCLGVSMLFSLVVMLLRHCRRMLLSAHLEGEARGRYFLVDDVVFLLLFALVLIVAEHVSSGVVIPGALLLSEVVGLVMLRSLSREEPVQLDRRHMVVGFIYGLAACGIFVAAFALHGEWLGRARWVTKASMVDVHPSAFITYPDLSEASLPLEVEGVHVSRGAPFFSHGKSYREQMIGADFVMPSNSTLDVVFQQQAFMSRGDPDGERMPLQRRLLRLSTLGRCGVGFGGWHRHKAGEYYGSEGGGDCRRGNPSDDLFRRARCAGCF